jgi:hypothetical protein
MDKGMAAHMMIMTIYRVKHLGEHDPKAACKPLTRTIEYTLTSKVDWLALVNIWCRRDTTWPSGWHCNLLLLWLRTLLRHGCNHVSYECYDYAA